MKNYTHTFVSGLAVLVTINQNVLTLTVKGRPFTATYPKEFNLEGVGSKYWDLMLWMLFYGFGLQKEVTIGGFLTELPAVDSVFTDDKKLGGNVLLSYSGGQDSTAVYIAMPHSIPVFIDRSFNSVYTANQKKAVKAIPEAITVKTDFEMIRTCFKDKYGFNHGMGYAAMLIPLVELLDARYLSFGAVWGDMGFWYSPAGLTYVGDAQQTKILSIFKVFRAFGIEPIYPIAGLSEVWTTQLVQESRFKNLACSCHLQIKTNYCGACYKCLRRRGYLGHQLNLNDPSIRKMVSHFLGKKPLKMAPLTVYGIQKAKYNLPGFDLSRFDKIDVSFCDRYNDTMTRLYNDPPTYDHMIRFFRERGISPQTDRDRQSIDLFCNIINQDKLYKY